MMIDPSIPLQVKPLQIPSSSDALAKILPLLAGQQQIKLADLQYTKMAKDMADEDATKTALSGYLSDPTSVSLADLAKTSPNAVFKIQEQLRNKLKDDAEINLKNAQTKTAQIEGAGKRYEATAARLGSAKDATSYELARASTEQDYGPEAVKNWPTAYNADWVQQQVKAGMSAKDQIEAARQAAKDAQDKAFKERELLISGKNADSTRMSAEASRSQAGTAAGRLALDRQLVNMPEGQPFKVRNMDSGEVVEVMKNKKGDILDINTKQPVGFKVGYAENITPQGAGQVAMLAQGKRDVDRAIGLMFDKDEQGNPTTMKRLTVAEARTPFTAGGWSDDSRQAYSYIQNAVQAKLRAETGAAAPDSEVANIVKRFMPSPMEGSKVAIDKANRLKEFFDLSLDELRRGGYISSKTQALPGSIPELAAQHGGKPVP